jgi:hypothetical protein
LVRVVTTHLKDLPILDTHELTDRDVQSAAGVLGGTAPDGHDVLGPHRHVEDLRSERAPAEGAKLRQKPSRIAGQPRCVPAMRLVPGRCQMASSRKHYPAVARSPAARAA